MNTDETKISPKAVIAASPVKTADEVRIQLFEMKQELDYCHRKVNKLKRKLKRRLRIGSGRYD